MLIGKFAMGSNPGVQPEAYTNGTGKINGVVNGFSSHGGTKVTVVLGAQWGDEGKGKLVDLLASDVDIVCRCQVRSYHYLFFMFFLIIIANASIV